MYILENMRAKVVNKSLGGHVFGRFDISYCPSL